MKQFLKRSFIVSMLLVVLTGCVFGSTKQGGASADNLDDEVIISQIKARMKEEMDRIGFEVDLENYAFYPYVTQTGATFGTVTMSDKRYPGYGVLEVYRGTFGSKKENKPIDKTLVATNPIIFVMNGYQDYTVKHIFNNKELGNDVEGALKATGGKMTKYSSSFSYDESRETDAAVIGIGTEEEVLKGVANTSFMLATKKQDGYSLNYFTGKKAHEIDYNEMINKFQLFSVVGIHIETTKDECEQKQEEVRKYYNPSTLIIVLTTSDALVKK